MFLGHANKATSIFASNTGEDFARQPSTCQAKKGRQAKRARDRQLAPKHLFRCSTNLTDSSSDPNQNVQILSKGENDTLTRKFVVLPRPQKPVPVCGSDTDTDSDTSIESDFENYLTLKLQASFNIKNKQEVSKNPAMATSSLTTSLSNPTTSKSIPSRSESNSTILTSDLSRSISNSPTSKSKPLNSTPDPSTTSTSNPSTKTPTSTKAPRNKPEKLKRTGENKKSKKENLTNISNAGNEQEKAYDDWSYIQEGYGELLDHLDPDNPDSEVDKVVKYILDKNIRVRHLNIQYSHLSLTRYFARCYKAEKNLAISGVKIGRFSVQENDIIRKQWDQLMHKAKVRDSELCLEDFEKIKVCIFSLFAFGCCR
jgi:hypothetical protein